MLKRRTFVTAMIIAASASVMVLRAQTAATPKPAPAAAKHSLVKAADLKWAPAPPGLPAGAQMAVVEGDPTKTGAFVIRAKFPDGYKVPPHWHPTDENLTVLAGSLSVGTGDKLDEAAGKPLGVHDFAHMPKQMHHYVIVKGDTEIQINGMGPFAITYVNPNDDPRKKTTTPSTK